MQCPVLAYASSYSAAARCLVLPLAMCYAAATRCPVWEIAEIASLSDEEALRRVLPYRAVYGTKLAYGVWCAVLPLRMVCGVRMPRAGELRGRKGERRRRGRGRGREEGEGSTVAGGGGEGRSRGGTAQQGGAPPGLYPPTHLLCRVRY
eukprot:2988702-Rhodomonas_salina.1